MNEIERAIEWFTGRDKRYALSDKCAEMERIALTALREKMEREKGCAACGLLYTIHAESYGIEDLDCADEPIDNKFCPMCGREVEVEP